MARETPPSTEFITKGYPQHQTLTPNPEPDLDPILGQIAIRRTLSPQPFLTLRPKSESRPKSLIWKCLWARKPQHVSPQSLRVSFQYPTHIPQCSSSYWLLYFFLRRKAPSQRARVVPMTQATVLYVAKQEGFRVHRNWNLLGFRAYRQPQTLQPKHCRQEPTPKGPKDPIIRYSGLG